MPISFKMEQVIELPPNRVFNFLAQPSNLALWNYYIMSAVIHTPGNFGQGTVLELIRKKDRLTYKVIEYAPPYRLAVQLQPPLPKQQFSFEVTAAQQFTHLTYTWQIELEDYSVFKYIPNGLIKNLLLAIPRSVILRFVKPATQENFGKLKTLLQTGKVTLQDGRETKLP